MIAPHPAVDSAVFWLKSNLRGTGILSLHNIAGYKVNEFECFIGDSGTERIVWDGTNTSGNEVASGIYIGIFSFKTSVSREKFALIMNK
jgi:hypothetical protein